MLQIQNLHASIDGKEILKGFNLQVAPGEIHALMGPNGAGKSTLAKVLAGHPAYEVTQGAILLDGQNILELDPEERAKLGLFMSFQYPLEIPGVTNFQFLHSAYNACKGTVSEAEFEKILQQKMNMMNMREEFKDRSLNEGFSGGEKKRNEILQMAVLEPKIAILDETDSGLDIDAMKIVADGVKQLLNADRGLLLITHYQRLLDYIKPDFVHVVVDGKIVESGGFELASKLEKQGYNVY
jgi:Fe-S cluster assembly ATP-binding protein